MNTRKPSGARRALCAAALAAAALLGACGGGGDAPSVPTAGAAVAAPPVLTVTEQSAPAPIVPPVPLPGVGAQFALSPTGTAYPKLDTLYPGHDGPVVDDGMVQPWLSHKAPKRFTVSVQSAHDTDDDGRPDRLTLRIVQPAEVDSGLKTPVIVRPTPYIKETDKFNFEQQHRAPFLGETQYLRMGFTVVYTDSLGTNTSEGCPSIMDGMERDANAAVVRWLANDPLAKGFDENDRPIDARAWSTGHVAMEGVSYGGTMPIMAAATGVTGLEAIVPVAGISNAYDYFARYNGVAPDAIPTMSVVEYVKSLTPPGRVALCSGAMNKLEAGADEQTKAYNAFWKERNTLDLAGNIKAATLIAHGQSDNNVKAKNAIQLYDALYRLKKPVQLWFHSHEHDDPAWQKEWQKEWQKQIVLWYSRYLFGVNNGVEAQPTYVRETPASDTTPGYLPMPGAKDPRDTLPAHCSLTDTDPIHPNHDPRDCISTGELMVKEQAWPETRTVSYALRRGPQALGGTLVPAAGGAPVASELVFRVDGHSGFFAAKPLADAARFAGAVRLVLPVKFAAAPVNLKAFLYVDDVPVTLGWANPHFYKGLEKSEDIVPGAGYDVTLEMMPRDFTVAPGSKISISIHGYNSVSPVNDAQTMTIDMARARLEMPLVPKARVEAAMRID